ncbi:sporozoite micronemal protein essential for cell traversal [Plasmodium gaboni]|uniref:Sporozoite micronemal protein essential for cell traversal n=1 Tax=Plasmodium gaboni TaxID=647221 RepID=A0A151LUD3_9APIC|nr:sporozoite micronemal protein essential for cell traversal [Plasmodium gaboni]KYO02795.1 sporozoite micronemal protein essential for cell traversal [Plasmodium gaboni]
MKLRILKKHYYVVFILWYLYDISCFKCIRLNHRSIYKNKYKNNVHTGTNENITSIEKYSNVLCNSILCKNDKISSFINQRKNVDEDESENDDMYESTTAGSSSETDEEQNEDSSNDNSDEEQNEDSSNDNSDEENEEQDKKIKHSFNLANESKHTKEEKVKEEKKLKIYDFINDKEKRLNSNREENDEDNEEKDDVDENTLANSNVISKHTSVFPGLYFIGIGYNLLFGNPLGEADSLIDPGYRAQIYLMEWALSKEGIANDLSTLQPLNGWIRKENACSRVESITECSSISDYTKSLSAEAKVSGSYWGLASFSASTGYSSFLHEVTKRSKKTFLVKSNCVKYTIGLPPYIPWDKTTAYKNAVNELPAVFTGLDKDSECPSDVYEENKTKNNCENVSLWMKFFDIYGTHIIYESQLGGKITKIINVSTSSIEQMKKNGVSVKAKIQAQFGFGSAGGSTNVNSSNSSANDEQSYDMNEQLIVIGGNPIKDVTKEENLFEWSKTVTNHPMPINIKLTPISDSFDSDDLKESYDKAIIYYSRLYGLSPHDTMQKDDKDIIKILTNADTVTKNSAPPINAQCPHGKVVMFGFSIKQNFWDNTNALKGYNIEVCEAGSNSCTSKQGSSNKYDTSYLYMECGDQPLPFSEQVISESTSTYNTVKCPNDYSILLGFGISSSSGRINSAEYVFSTPCRPGMKSCSLNMNNNNQKSYIYAVCVDTTIWSGVNNLSLVALDGAHGKVDRSKKYSDGELVGTCPLDGTVLTGFKVEFHTSSPYVQTPFEKCAKSLKACSVHGSGHAIGIQNFKSLFIYMLCKNNK